jgi:excisionase family DNA binding protein
MEVDMESSNRVMTVKEVAVALRISTNHTYLALQRGQIPGAFKIGGKWLVSRSAVERLLDGQEPNQAA